MRLSWLFNILLPSQAPSSPLMMHLNGVRQTLQVQLQQVITGNQVFEKGDRDQLTVRGISQAEGFHPITSDSETILNFAKMSSNSYQRKILSKSIDRDETMDKYNGLGHFGWDGNGLRGHIYANAARSLVIIAFKGTSTLLMGGGTVSMDKYIDNMMFSCCCARVGISWIPVCGCYLGGDNIGLEEGHSSSGRCNQTCLEVELREDENSYYQDAIRIVKRVQKDYPLAQLWFTGHSLGGAIASLMAVTFKSSAAITFSAPGDRLYAERLGISNGPYWAFPIWNFGVNTDPIFMGTCHGLSSSCHLSGYAMETKCRHGRDCVIQMDGREGEYDVNTHRIDWLVENVLQGNPNLPTCYPNIECSDCALWSFERPLI